jgi:hypothetical protein
VFSDGRLWVREKVEASGFCAIRLDIDDGSPIGSLNAGVNAALDILAAVGVTGDGMFGLAVIDIPPDADLTEVRDLLEVGRREGWWTYQDLCVTEAWKATAPA